MEERENRVFLPPLLTFLVLRSGCRGWGWWLICDIGSHGASGGGGEVSHYLSLVQVLPLTRGWITNRVSDELAERWEGHAAYEKKMPGRESSLLKMPLTTSELNLSFFFKYFFFPPPVVRSNTEVSFIFLLLAIICFSFSPTRWNRRHSGLETRQNLNCFSM